ncbi:MAG: ADP-ribose diphosphatase [Rhodospirillales bacterium]|nr:ADP-ribose diphosphatase [Rhodospirillales bacterium]
MNDPAVRIVSKTALFRGFASLWSVHFTHRTHDGGWSAELEREVFKRANSAAVLPYDPVRDEIVLLEQFRPGAHLAGRGGFTLEPPAGLFAAGAGDATALARAEAREEAGCELSAFEPVCTFLVSPSCMTETVFVYCGRADTRHIGGVHGRRDEGEDIKVHVMPFARARAELDAGRFEVGLTIICLQWLVIHRDRLRAKWRAASVGGA